MSSQVTWNPYRKHVQGGIREGDFVNAQFVLLSAGPPHLSNFGGPTALAGGQDLLYPIGVAQSFSHSQNRMFSRIFEIGSERSYYIPGRSVGQVSLSRTWIHGPNLLRGMYAHYQGSKGGFPKFDSLLPGANYFMEYPYKAGTSKGIGPGDTGRMHDVRLSPGYENFFINLGSDIFQYPIGLLVFLRDSEEQAVGAFYLEQCYIPTHTWGMDAQGMVIQEMVGVQYERLVPINVKAVKAIRGIVEGSYPTPQFAALDIPAVAA